jgi:hypothetical protein
MSKVQLERYQRLCDVCKRVIAGDNVTKAEFESAVLKYVYTQYDDPTRVLKRLHGDGSELGCLLRKAAGRFINKELDDQEISPLTGAAYSRTRRPPDDDDADDDRGRDDDDDDNGDIEKAEHVAGTVADLLVESGRFPHRTAALDHLLNSPRGNALLARLHKAEAHTGKDHSTMDRTTELRDIAKAGGIVAVAKAITDTNRSYGITEHEFVELATEHAKAQHPELTEAQAFAKLYQIPEIWRCCDLLKSMPFHANVTPMLVGGEANRGGDVNPNDPSEAIEQLKQLGRDRWPTASEAQQFERALIAPEYHKLARVAVPIPRAPADGMYPYPR